ncbi:MAG: hypothetical protein ACI9Y7_002104 [Dokdonia sp.]|jgi:hypothetical protein
MPKLTKKQLLIFCSILLLVDIVFIKLDIDHRIKPDLFMSGGLERYRIVIIFFNLVLTFIVLLFNRKYALLFLANTIVCGLLITFLWNLYLETHPFSMTKYWFEHKHKNYVLHVEKNPNAYIISYVKDSLCFADLNSRDEMDTIMRNTVRWGFLEKKEDSILLHKDFDFETRLSSYMYFYKDTLIGFPEKETKIKVTKINNW